MKRGARGLGLDYVALHDRYLAGESGTAIAREIGIDYTGLYRAWQRRGLKTRTQRDAKLLLYQQRPELRDSIKVAQDARRGRTDPIERREARALTRERLQLGTSQLEDMVARWLDDWRIPYARQKAIGPYNVDFALTGIHVALDIDGGGHNPRVRANRANRSRFIESEGWQHEHIDHRTLSEQGLWQYLLQLHSHTTGAQSRVP